MDIPRKFRNVNDESFPVCATTVGELQNALAELPKEMPIEGRFTNNGVRLVVYNYKEPDFGQVHLGIEDIEDE